MGIFDTPNVQVQSLQIPNYLEDAQNAQNFRIKQAEYNKNQVIARLRPQAFTDPNAFQQLANISPDEAKKVQDDIVARHQRAAAYTTTINLAERDKKPEIYRAVMDMARNDPLIDPKELAKFPAEYSPAVDAQLYSISQSYRDLENGLKAQQERANLGQTYAQTQHVQAQTEKARVDTLEALNRNNPNFIAEKERAITEGKNFGEQNVKYINEIQDKAQTAASDLQLLDSIETGLDTIGETGVTTNLQNSIISFANQRGIKVDRNKIATAQEVQSTINRLVLGAVKTSGLGSGTGFSDADREFLIKQFPKLTNTYEGNKKIVAVIRKMKQRDLEIAELTQQLKEKGITDRGMVQKAIKNYSNDNPLFGKEEKTDKEAETNAINSITGGQSFKSSNGLTYTIER